MKAEFEKKYVNKIIQGNALGVMASMPAESANCIITSPPYWGLRAYKTGPVIWGGDKNCEHKWGITPPRRARTNKDSPNSPKQTANRAGADNLEGGNICSLCGAWRGELGLEPDISLYIEHLMMVFDEAKRVLRKDGVMFVNIGDTYSATRWSNKPSTTGISRVCSDIVLQKQTDLQAKSLCNIPEKFSIAMEQHGWIKRCNIIWAKGLSFCDTYSGSCMPDSARDRPNKNGFEWVYMFTKQSNTQFWVNSKTNRLVGSQPAGTNGVEGEDWEWIEHSACEGKGCNNKRCVNGKVKSSLWSGSDYWYEQQYEEAEPASKERYKYDFGGQKNIEKKKFQPMTPVGEIKENPLGRTIRNVWAINPQPFSEAHFATFPEKLVEPMLKMGCPEFVCKKCGKARVKIIKAEGGAIGKDYDPGTKATGTVIGHSLRNPDAHNGSYKKTLIGYTDCGCGADFRPGVVLDMFGGSGTVGKVAAQLKRDYVLIELQGEYIKIAEERLKAVDTGVPVSEQRAGQKGLFEKEQ